MTATTLAPLTDADRRAVLEDLADAVHSDRRGGRTPRIWTDRVLAQLVPTFATATLPATAQVALFLSLVEARADTQRADVENGDAELAEAKSKHFLHTLVPDGAP